MGNIKLIIHQFQFRIRMEKIEAMGSISDSEQQFLQPISKFYPPNQIITKNYSPDERPILKLMKLDKHEIGTCQDLKKKYKSLFDAEDTLGYQYSYSLTNEIVYLKFNNQNYFKHKIKNKTYKFLSGLFVPAEKLLSPEVKQSKNIYKILPQIEYAEYKTNAEESFSKNCRFTNIKTVRFSSNYESSNLFIAMKKKQYEYDLIIQNDINSKGNTQWFNFITEFHQEGTYKFNILNFTKSYSQYEDGMRIVYFSYKEEELGIGGWARGCSNITYQESSVKREDAEYKNYSCLKFEYTCNYPTDKVIFAYFYPYTSLDLEKFFKKTLYRKINVHMRMEKIKVCETLSGLPVYVISIQHKINHKPEILSGNNTTKSMNAPPLRQNKSVIFLARQHPGETQGSFISEGIIDVLMQNGELDYLKKNIDFYVFPMVNIDGVLYGNYRTNLSGTDLNRIWRNPKKQFHPEVYYIKKYLNIINKESPIALIVDLHGHSKSLNSFFYGNPPKKDLITGTTEDPRLFPYVCSKKIKQISFNQSTFNITDDKKNSARVVMSQMFPRAHVYTLQNSFHGWRKDNSTIHEYTPEVLRKIGRELVITYLEFDKLCEKNPQIKQKWSKEITEIKVKNDVKSEDSEGGSDSEAQFQLIELEEPLQKLTSIDNINHERSLFSAASKSELMNLLKKQKKQNFISRNLMIKTQIYHNRNFNRYGRKVLSPQQSSTLTKQKKEQKQLKNAISASNQGFLSIVKIKTTNQSDPLSSKSTNFYSQSSQKSLAKQSKFQKQNIIKKLKRKKIRIEEAVNSSSGIKNFLKTMGIPLEKKVY